MPTRYRILLVEDDPVITHLIVTTLGKAGYEVLKAENGLVALESLATSKPDLILLDIYLPVLNGWDFLEQYQTLPDHSAPVVAFSASELDRALPDHVSLFLLKPFKMADLIKTVAEYLPPSVG
jgi:CheY-like chemotaxis protein